jgi:hypothetical protein
MRVMRLGTFKDLYKHQVASIASSLIPCDKSSEQILPRNELSRSMMQLQKATRKMLLPDCVEHLMSKCLWQGNRVDELKNQSKPVLALLCKIFPPSFTNSGIRCSQPKCFLTLSFGSCPYHHHAHLEFQKHEGMDEPAHVAQDHQFILGKFR